MTSLQNTVKYVKFVRGTKTAWEALKTSGQVYDDTLYFIYESAQSSTGVLYLGTKQIGGTDGSTEVPINLADLEDVLLDAGLASNQILVYNGQKWINSSIEDIISLDNSILDLNNAGELTLTGFDAATVGTIPQKSEDGSITWIEPGNLSEITEINNQLQEVYTKEEVNNLLTAANHLSYKKVGSLDEIDTSATDAANYIYLVPTGDTGSNKFNEYIYIDQNLEPVGNWEVNLDDYVTYDVFGSKVAELSGLIENNNTTISNFMDAVGDLSTLVVANEGDTLVNQVNLLTQSLTWQEIIE